MITVYEFKTINKHMDINMILTIDINIDINMILTIEYQMKTKKKQFLRIICNHVCI